MMHYILIILFVDSNSAASIAVEFNSQAACTVAAQEYKKQTYRAKVVLCTAKG